MISSQVLAATSHVLTAITRVWAEKIQAFGQNQPSHTLE